MDETREVLIGQIKGYLFQSEDSLYKVARILLETNEEQIIVGYFPLLGEGLTYEFVGFYKEHAKYGKQFVVSSYTQSKNFTKAGLIAYLSSSRFIGIGPKLATNIVEQLGVDCIQKILKDDSCLDHIRLMSSAKKEILSTILKDNFENEQVLIRLYGFGLSNTMVYRLMEHYGLDAANRIEENPYLLIYEMDGFGFKKSDQLALNLGFDEKNPLRLKEALKYALHMVCYQQGFTFVTKSQLISSTAALLNFLTEDRHFLEDALEELIGHRQVIVENERVFEPVLYQAEIKMAEGLIKMSRQGKPSFSQEKIKQAIQEVQKDLEMIYTDLQQEAIVNSLSSKLSVITGGPGTGKSTIICGILRTYAKLNHLVFPCEELDMKIALMAPTGRAAKRMEEVTHFKATTIHKALGYNYEGMFTKNEKSPLSVSLVIVDEASMMDTELSASLIRALPSACQLIFVGDENQLPSVSPGNVFHDLIASDLFSTVRLRQIMRQAKDSDIIRFSNMIMEEQIDYRIFSAKKEVYFYPCEAGNLKWMLYKLLDAYLSSGNDLFGGIQVLIPMYAGIAGIDAMNEAISNRYNPQEEKIVREERIFKKDDKVLQLKNEPELGIMNGDIGKILEIVKKENQEILVIDFDGKILSYPTKNLDDLRLAYAISVHKSQGSEYDYVILPILPCYSRMLRKKIIYTAATRAKKKLILVGQIETLNQAIHTLETPRQTGLLSRLSQKTTPLSFADSNLPFDDLGEYGMENITPYTFME